MKNTFLIFLALNSFFCISQSLTITVPEHHFSVDTTNMIVVSHIENIESFNDLSNNSEVILSLNQTEYSFTSLPNSIRYTESYLINDTSSQFILYFTELPIISIESQNSIIDDPKVHANLIYADSLQVLTSNIGIELRGGFSQSYPKNTYDIELWEDELGDETQSVQFGDLRSDDDWILDALYNEPLRIRSQVAHKLFLEMHTPHYSDDEPKAKSGADVMYAELFLNGVYNGLYNLSEQVDKKQLKLKSFNGTIRGELYKGTSWGNSTFTNLSDYNDNSNTWDGYELKYPKEEDTTSWNSVYQFTDFVMNSTNNDFKNQIWDTFEYENYLDYFIFLNLLRATDNTGKNIYLAKYTSDQKYFYVPWDLDGCFGTIWDGTNRDTTDDILTNGFFDKVIDLDPDNYSEDVSTQWFDYRTNILDESNLIATFEDQYNYFLDFKVYERESLVHPNYSFEREDLTYLTSWTQNRLSYLDEYFGTLLSVNDVNSNNKESHIYPNPTRDKLYFDDSILSKTNAYTLYNSMGILINKGLINENSISTTGLTQGPYIIFLNNIAYKFVVN